MDEKTKLINDVRALLRRDPNLTPAGLKKAQAGTRPVAFYSILLQEAREAEEAVSEQLAGETQVAQEAADSAEEAAPECWLVEPNGQAVQIEWTKTKGARSYFRRLAK